jgi:uncharacterized protein
MSGLFADNITHFARVLRHAGLPIGTDRVVAAIEAVQCVGVENRRELRAALFATLLSSKDQALIFDRAFHAFWRDPKLLERLMYLVLPKVGGRSERRQNQHQQRLDEALRPKQTPDKANPAQAPQDQEKIEFEALLTMSERERLQQADFETMSTQEFAVAKRLAREAALPLKPRRERRWTPAVMAAHRRFALRASLRASVRQPDTLALRYEAQRLRPAPVVCLLDISGSMERYSRMFLHYAHALMQQHQKQNARVHVFVFGTRLTNVTRALRQRDPDEALERADRAVADWKGGTRIASSLQLFNRLWARRVLGGGANVLLITDGLDRDEGGELGVEAERLSKLSRQLVWLNPLLRFDQFEPRAAGIKAILPHVDAFLPVHNVASLQELSLGLSAARLSGKKYLRQQ